MLGRVLASFCLIASVAPALGDATPIRFDLEGDGAPEQVTIARDGTVSFTTSAGVVVATVPGIGAPRDGESSVHLALRDRVLERFQRAPGVARCDGEDRLFVERFVLAQRAFERVSLAPPVGRKIVATVADIAQPKGAKVFRAVAASTERDASGRADRLAPPVELDDGIASTTWVAGSGDDARGQWVTLRSKLGPVELRAMTLRFAAMGAPERIVVVTSARAEDRLEVDIPHHADRVTIPLDTLPPSDCVSITVAIAAPLSSTQIADVRVVSALDDSKSVPILVARVARGDEEAARILRDEGPAAAVALAEAFEHAQGAARRSLLRALIRFDHEGSTRALATALSTASAEESPLLVEGLLARRAAGVAAAWQLVEDSKQTDAARLAALAVLERADAKYSLSASTQLLGQLGVSATIDQGIEAYFASLLRRGAISQPVLARTIEDELARIAPQADARRVALLRLLCLTANASSPDRILAILDRHTDLATQLFAIRLLGRSALPASQARLTRLATQSPNEVVRTEATRHVAELPPETFEDSDPAVRAIAVARALSVAGGAHVDAAIARLERDPWPMVREAAIAQLESRCRTLQPAVRARVLARLDSSGERHAPTRRKLVAAVPACGVDEAVPILVRVLLDRREGFGVRAQAAIALSRLPRPAAPPLVRALGDALDAVMQDEQAVALGLASLRGIARAGDSSHATLTAIGGALHDMAWPALRAAAYETLGALCPPEAEDAFRRGPEDPDAQVRQAADRARTRCRRR